MIRSSLGLLILLLLSLPAAQPSSSIQSRQSPASSSETQQVLRRRLIEKGDKAIRLLEEADADCRGGQRARCADRIKQAVAAVTAITTAGAAPLESGSGPLLAPASRQQLKALSGQLTALARQVAAGRADAFSPKSLVEALRAATRSLQPALPAGLNFQGTYTRASVVDQSAGGHASAPGAGPRQSSSLEDLRAMGGQPAVALDFEEIPALTEKTFCGGLTKDHILESSGSGVALLDYDQDGLLDIYVVNAFELDATRERIAHRNALYRNLGNWRFQNVARQAGVDAAAWGTGVCAGDFDNDGYLDLFVTNYGSNFLFRNNSDGTFTDVAARAGVAAPGWNTSCSFFDADGDGDLDLYMARYVTASWEEVVAAERTMIWRGGPKVMVGPAGLPGARDLFFRNKGNGTFNDVTQSSGLNDEEACYGFGVLATDYDADGWIDLYVANDSNPNFLYHNLGAGRFENIGLAAGAALSGDGRAQAGMGVDAADYDGNGLLDLIVTNFAHDTNTLYRNLGGRFEDVSEASGLSARTFKRLGWGVVFFDADLDGDCDLFFANGHIYPQVDEVPSLEETFLQKNQLLLNERGRFLDVSDRAGTGLQVLKSSRGVAAGDLDNDGDLDLVVTNMDDVPTLLRNQSRASRHWIALELKREGTNRFCIGARVTVRASGRSQIREVRSGGSYLSQNDLRAHFGLGSYAGAVAVEVQLGRGRWRWEELSPDRYHVLVLDEQHRVD